MSLPAFPPELRFGAPAATARGALVLVHGRGSCAADIARLAEIFPLGQVSVVAPEARGGTWYPERFLAPLERNEPALGEALALIERLVTGLEADGLPRERIGLIGFSQGACLVLEYASRRPARYGFVAGLSGALIGPLATPRPHADLRSTPVLLGCATHDAHIPLAHVEHSAAVLAGFQAEVTKQIFPGTAHTVFAEELTWLRAQDFTSTRPPG